MTWSCENNAQKSVHSGLERIRGVESARCFETLLCETNGSPQSGTAGPNDNRIVCVVYYGILMGSILTSLTYQPTNSSCRFTKHCFLALVLQTSQNQNKR